MHRALAEESLQESSIGVIAEICESTESQKASPEEIRGKSRSSGGIRPENIPKSGRSVPAPGGKQERKRNSMRQMPHDTRAMPGPAPQESARTQRSTLRPLLPAPALNGIEFEGP